MSSVPSDYQFLLPSSPIENLDSQRDREYIISSLLKNATLSAWRWLFSTYTHEEIISVLKTTKTLRKKDVMIWSAYLDINPEEIACLQTKSQSGLKSSWTY